MKAGYEMVIGLEVHVELKTKTKIFCSCPTDFGAEPNTQCCPVCTGMPGSLPVLNEQVVDYAIQAGLATNCTIAKYSKQDRKNYFYPDLPKAYQISQYDLPLCEHGYLDIELDQGQKRIGITRIHIEEDAGKLVHVEGKGTFVDCNRCGVPLIEIVSEPDIRSAEEAKAYLQKLRAIILYTGISDCKMNEGSLRCDVNLSVRKKGDEKLGTRTEMKNLNSFQFIVKAIEYEADRQIAAIEAGEEILQETRRFDANTGKTYSMRKKEDADDYRYFPDPDLAPIVVSEGMLDALKEKIPTLPDARKQQYVAQYGLSRYAAEQLVSSKKMADYFEAAQAHTHYPVLVANILLSDISRLLQQEQEEDATIPIQPQHIGALAEMMGDGRINSRAVRQSVDILWKEDQDPVQMIQQRGMEQISDEKLLTEYAQSVIAEQQKSVADYKSGKQAAFQALVGQMMKKTQGKGNPVMIQEILKKLLDQ